MLSVASVAIVAIIGYAISGIVGYRVTALMLMVTVSLLAMFTGIGPVLLAAILSALVWDFFFIPPRFTFHVETTEDALLLLMYFIIALVTGTLMLRLRIMEEQQRDKEEKEKTIKLYNTLLNSLSHELRTPLATIMAAADHLHDNFPKLDNRTRNELIDEISTASQRLTGQVDNLLNMSRLESGTVQPKKDWCDVNEIIYSVIHSLQDAAIYHRIDVKLQQDMPLFKLDYGMVEQLLQNLVVNAIHYTPKGSEITIESHCRYNSCVITVSDNGNGFPEDELEKVFEKFYRLDNTKTGGTGLGLSIVKGFTEAQGGAVTLENGIGGGAKFTVEIPTETSYINSLKHE